ncbi:hypothetical protein Cgig2_021969 [Carnegiea gigantea]|uniref:DM2 domain-containing protein n=1 Tax=Carnegiea gigantea TaxID=171969 RepID=A0A9Q1KT43_9CARY|nr:hypothetical protein Cgig2_021969 [Carnegiea gigantea]
MATTAWRAIGGKCRALLMAAKSSAAAATTTAAASKAAKPANPRTPSATAPAAAASGVNKEKGIVKRVPVSPALGEFLGSSEASRTDAVKKVWEYIRAHDLQTHFLQNPSNKREIICDEKLKTVFGKDKVGFLEIARLLSQHFVKSANNLAWAAAAPSAVPTAALIRKARGMESRTADCLISAQIQTCHPLSRKSRSPKDSHQIALRQQQKLQQLLFVDQP